MEWTDHDVLMLREMVVSDVFSFQKGSVSRGDAWDSIAEKLNQIDSPQFRIKDKRGVRERWKVGVFNTELALHLAESMSSTLNRSYCQDVLSALDFGEFKCFNDSIYQILREMSLFALYHWLYFDCIC